MRYWFNPTMSWRTFKKLQKISKDDGPTPEHGDRVLYEMLKERKINMFIDTKQKDDPICITTKNIPKKGTMLCNPKYQCPTKK